MLNEHRYCCVIKVFFNAFNAFNTFIQLIRLYLDKTLLNLMLCNISQSLLLETELVKHEESHVV